MRESKSHSTPKGSSHENKPFRHFLLVTALAATLFSLLMSALMPSIRAWAKEKYAELQVFTKVLNIVQEYYVEEVDTKELLYGGIKGMLQVLDPHTNFLPPELHKQFSKQTKGKFGGLGIEITVQKSRLTVIAPIEDTPAWKAGIKAGDHIVSINGQSTKGMSVAEAAQLMQGKRGTKIVLGIMRSEFDKPKEFAIVRDVIRIKSVKTTDLEGGYLYLRLTSFVEASGQEVEKAIRVHQKKHKHLAGLILDFRNNPGGLLVEAFDISNLFLDGGVVVSTVGRNSKTRDVMRAKKEGTLPDFPLIVLINGSSASASEIVAGALQDNGRALIMGERSFGKASVQSIVKLGDGSALKLTVARYYTPNGTSIQAEGIVPDIIVDNVKSDVLQKALVESRVRREKDIEGHLEDEESGTEKAQSLAKHEEPTSVFWKHQEESDDKDDKKESKKLTPKDELLSKDFQALQAYNYLRAWNVLHPDKTQKMKKKSE